MRECLHKPKPVKMTSQSHEYLIFSKITSNIWCIWGIRSASCTTIFRNYFPKTFSKIGLYVNLSMQMRMDRLQDIRLSSDIITSDVNNKQLMMTNRWCATQWQRSQPGVTTPVHNCELDLWRNIHAKLDSSPTSAYRNHAWTKFYKSISRRMIQVTI